MGVHLQCPPGHPTGMPRHWLCVAKLRRCMPIVCRPAGILAFGGFADRVVSGVCVFDVCVFIFFVSTFRETIKSNQHRVQLWSGIQILVIMLVGFLQVLLLDCQSVVRYGMEASCHVIELATHGMVWYVVAPCHVIGRAKHSALPCVDCMRMSRERRRACSCFVQVGMHCAAQDAFTRDETCC